MIPVLGAIIKSVMSRAAGHATAEHAAAGSAHAVAEHAPLANTNPAALNHAQQVGSQLGVTLEAAADVAAVAVGVGALNTALNSRQRS
jgi:hypothetical protein